MAERIEKDGKGLNLTIEVLDGIECHTGDKTANTKEGRIVHYADRIAYINHDIDDAIRARILREEDIPFHLSLALGNRNSIRINTLVGAVLDFGLKTGEIGMESKWEQLMEELRAFMFRAVYQNPVAKEAKRAREWKSSKRFLSTTRRIPMICLRSISCLRMKTDWKRLSATMFRA